MLADRQGRSFKYLRLSVTDACNFRCTYCLPNGYVRPLDHEAPLSVDEISRLVRGFARLGIEKVRLTGGEPTTRRDIVEIARRVRAVDGVRTIAVSTNGYRLTELAPELAAAGVTQVNVSVDSLAPERYRAITGHDSLPAVLAGIDRAIARGLVVKVNAVLLRDENDAEIERFIEWTKDSPVSVRFIELMRTGDNELFFLRRHSPLQVIERRLQALGYTPRARQATDGPAVTYAHAERAGTIGLIAPYSKDFCVSCNRLRVTSRGALRLCLFGDQNASLRHLLQRDDDREAIATFVRAALVEKAPSHRLHQGDVGNARNLAQMGG
ncbi:MAG: GTP 3',8-cyclase MoaA [Deltaproteobacteria bacterium]|nr:GTP 3',8-cyclase MoaA [Deltaproteobacteria bacterium]